MLSSPLPIAKLFYMYTYLYVYDFLEKKQAMTALIWAWLLLNDIASFYDVFCEASDFTSNRK